MDSNSVKNIGLDSSLNHNDVELLNQILSSMNGGGSKKAPKMTAKDKNNLISKLSSNSILNEEPKKELKDMNEQEKKTYREELKKKLKNKQNEFKMERNNNLAKQKISKDPKFADALEKLGNMIKNIDSSGLDSLNDVSNVSGVSGISGVSNVSGVSDVQTKNDSPESEIITNTNASKQEISANDLIMDLINGTIGNEGKCDANGKCEVDGELNGNNSIVEPDNLDNYLN